MPGVLTDVIPGKDTTSLTYSSQRCKPKSPEETLDKYIFRLILQSNWPVFFKSVNVMKDKS